MWMPQLEINNEEILECILKCTIGVISRRTTEAYASFSIANAIKKLRSKYAFLNYIEIKKAGFTQSNEFFKLMEIKPEINNEDPMEIVNAINDIIRNIALTIGKEAGYFFIKEIKETIPCNYEVTIKGTDPYVLDEDIFDINIDREDIETRFILDERGVDEA